MTEGQNTERERNVNRRAEQLKTEAKQQAWKDVEKKLTEISIQDTKSDQYLINLLVAQIECCGNSEFRSSFIEDVISLFDKKRNTRSNVSTICLVHQSG